MNEKAEQMVRQYAYRRLIMKGKLRLPHKAAARLIGPDCAYHLYGRHEVEAPRSDRE